jgi:predicted O-linked N-acetylglucosamine transferase (SPINDLY family)
LLSNVGFGSLIARNEDEYVDIAVRLAGESERLVQLRSSLREMMQESPLMDTPAFMQHLESAYRDMWRTWCAEKTQAVAAS